MIHSIKKYNFVLAGLGLLCLIPMQVVIKFISLFLKTNVDSADYDAFDYGILNFRMLLMVIGLGLLLSAAIGAVVNMVAEKYPTYSKLLAITAIVLYTTIIIAGMTGFLMHQTAYFTLLIILQKIGF